LFIASPGGGKGTTLDALRKKGIVYAELPFRQKLDREVGMKTAIGRQIDSFRKAGALVPNDIILPLVDEALEEVCHNELIVLDGFPRNVGQVDFALERLRHAGFENIIVFCIDTPSFTCVRRMANRGRDKQDTDPDNIANRLEAFVFETKPVIAYLRHNAEKLGIYFYMVDGENLQRNMQAYIRMIGIEWMVKNHSRAKKAEKRPSMRKAKELKK
jgi:adenylate kinase